jgi:magnesium transporter
MGGNAGTQTMTITVRAISQRELDRNRMGRLILREIGAGLVNGIIIAVIIGIITTIRFGDPGLGVVIALAMIINMLAAGTAGNLIPLGFKRVGVDPAVASTVFVTTVTDVLGFFAFLGLAKLWFHLM